MLTMLLSTERCSFHLHSNGTFSLYRGPASSGTLLGTRSYALGTGLYYSFEGKITTHDTAGSFEVRVDGLNRLSGANVDTKASGNASANGIAFGDNIGGSSNGQQDFYIDNLYTCDGQGATTASRRIAVDSYPPAADGAHSGLAPSSGMTHFSLVDETTPNEDADYNENATIEAKESYGFADMAYNPARRFGVQINLSVEKDDAGFHQINKRRGPLEWDRLRGRGAGSEHVTRSRTA